MANGDIVLSHPFDDELMILVGYTHTHPFNGPFSGTTWVSRYQKGKTNLDFTKARDSEWQWNPLGHMQVCTSLQTDNHASSNFLMVRALNRPILHCRTKLCKDRSHRYRDISIFVIFKMVANAILDFQKFEIFRVVPVLCPICVTMPNFVTIGQTFAEIWQFDGFFQTAGICHLGPVGGVLGPPTMTT